MANTKIISLADRNKKLGLRGDMTGANLDYTPPDAGFKLHFYTEDAKNYTLTSATHQFLIMGALATSFSFGGKAGLFAEFMYDPSRSLWVLTADNLTVVPTANGTLDLSAIHSVPAGGSTGQVLTKASNVDYATVWQTPTVSNGSTFAYPTGGTVGQYLGKTGSADGQVGWLTLPAGSGTGGAGGVSFTPEVLLTQATDGSFTPDKALGNNFRVMLTKNGKVLNPIGYAAGELITVVVRQSQLGPFTLEWDTNWAFPDRQPPKLASQPGGLNQVSAYLTADIDAGNKGGWLTQVTPPGTTPTASTVGYGVASYIARNTVTQISYYVLRSATLLSATTEMRNTDTLKILRNGLGIEAYGALETGVNGDGPFLISGALPNTNRAELRTGPGVRSAFNKGVLAVSGSVTLTVQDIILSGAREQESTAHIAQGFSVGTGTANVTLKNVRLYDNENGILTANDWTGTLNLIDCDLDANGVGDVGQTHNIYMGHSAGTLTALRTTFQNAATDRGGDGGHNIKSRANVTTLNQVRTYGSLHGREIDLPNGGKLYATDCIIEHPAFCAQNDTIRIGVEGVDTARPREYIFRNCHFVNGKPSGNGASYIWNDDAGTTVQCIDCTFEGVKGQYATGGDVSSGTWPGTDINGMIGPVSVTFTGGPKGPRLPAGYLPISVTQIAG